MKLDHGYLVLARRFVGCQIFILTLYDRKKLRHVI